MPFPYLKQTLLVIAVMTACPADAVKYRNGKIVHENREIGGGECFVSFEPLKQPSAVKKHERSIKDDDYAIRLDSEDYKIVSDIGRTVCLLERTLKAGSQKMHWDSGRLAPRPEKVEDIPPFDPRRIVRRLGLIPPPKNEEEAKLSQVKVYDYNPNGYFFKGQMIGRVIRCGNRETEWETSDYKKDQARWCAARGKERFTDTLAMDIARRELRAELNQIMKDRLLLMKMVDVKACWWRLRSDTQEGLVQKMKDLLQPEQLYEINEGKNMWDWNKSEFRAVVLNRPQLLQAMYPDSGIFQPVGTAGSFRNRCEIDFFNVGFPEDPGKCLPAGTGGNYRRGYYFNVTDEFTADPGSSLLFQVVSPYFPYGRELPNPYKSKQDRRINTNDRALVAPQPVVMSNFDKVRDNVQKRQAMNHMIAFKAKLERDSQMFSPLKVTHSDPGQMAPAGSGGHYRRGYHDSVARHIIRHRMGSPDLPLIFPLEFDESGRHFKGYNKYHSKSSEPAMSCADPGQLVPAVGKGGTYRQGYHDNVASEFNADPGRFERAVEVAYIPPRAITCNLKSTDRGLRQPIGDAPTAHFMRPHITVADLNAVIGRFKHVEKIEAKKSIENEGQAVDVAI